jgi:hypothetical protein
MAKRRGEYEKSAEIWKELLLDDSYRAMACEELAAHHERRSKNFEKAMEFARLGMKELRKPSAGMSNLSSPAAGPPASQLRRMERLEKRVARLTTKLNAIAPDSAVPLLKLGRRVVAGK